MVKWTDQENETLRNLWAGRYTAKQIAFELGKTKSAVLGRVFRLGLSDKSRAIAQQKKRRIEAQKFHARNSPPLKESKPLVRTKIKAPAPLNIILCDLGIDQCRWPVNTPARGGEYLFCGHKSDGGPYCTAHTQASIKKTLPNE